jgi:hypothetical protein
MKKYLLLIIFIVNSNFVFSQDDGFLKVMTTIIEYYSLELNECYDENTLINDLSYDIKYSGDNMENGMRKFVDNHPLKLRSSQNEKGIDGSVEAFRNTYNMLIDYLGEFKKINNSNTSMIYLAMGWKIIDDYLRHKMTMIRMNRMMGNYDDDLDDYAKIEFKLKSLQTDLVFRANMLSVNNAQGRQYLSLFDNRTYLKYGYLNNH